MVSFKDLSTYISVVSSVTRKSSESIGEGFKTIFARYQNVKLNKLVDDEGDPINDVEKVMNSVGIQIRKNSGEFEDFSKIIDELKVKWKDYSQVQQSAIANAFAGVRQRENFLVLMNNLNQVDALQQKVADSAGSAQKKFDDAYGNSTEAKINKLQNTIQKMWMGAINSSTVNGVLSGLNGLVSVLDFLVNNSFTKFIIQVGLISAALYGAGVAAIALKNSYLGTAIGVAALSIAENGLIASTKALTVAMLDSPLFLVVAGVMAVMGIVKAVDALTTSLDEQKQKVEDLTSEYDKMKSDMTGLEDQLSKTQDRITELNNMPKLSVTEENELQNLKLTNDELQKRIDLLKVQADFKNKEIADETVKLYKKQFGKNPVSEEAINNYVNNEDLQGENISVLTSDMSNLNAVIAAYKQYTKLRKEALNENNIGAVDYYDEQLNNIQKSITDTSVSLLDMKQKLEAVKNPTDEQKKALDSINLSLKYSDEILAPLKKSIEETSKKTDDGANTNKDYAKSFDELTKAVEAPQKAIADLNQIIADQADNQGMSADEAQKLIATYPELQGKIYETANGYMVEKSALETLQKAKIAEMNTTLDAQANNAKATLQSAQSQLSAFGIIIAGIKTLQDARVAASKVMSTYDLIQAGMAPQDAAKMQTSNDALRGQIIDYGKLLDQINSLKSLASSPSYGVSNYYSSNNKSAEDAAKKAEQAQQDAYSAIDDINGKLMDAIKKQVEEEKKALDERLDNYKNFIDEKLKALDDEYTAEDRKRKLDDENKKKADLQSQRDALLADSSDEAKALRNSLQEQIDTQQQVIDDLNRDYSREDQKANLNKQLEEFTKQIESQKSALDEKYSDEEVAKLAKNGLLTGLVSIGTQSMSVKDLLLEAMQKSGDAFTATGQKLQTELIDRLVKVQQLMQNMNGDGTISGNVALNVLGSHADGGKIYQKGLYELHPNEWVVNSTQGNILDKIVKNDYSFLRNFKVDMPNIPAVASSSTGGIQIGSIIGTVQGNVDRTTLPMLEKIVKDNLPQAVAEAQMNNNKKLGNYNPKVR